MKQILRMTSMKKGRNITEEVKKSILVCVIRQTAIIEMRKCKKDCGQQQEESQKSKEKPLNYI